MTEDEALDFALRRNYVRVATVTIEYISARTLKVLSERLRAEAQARSDREVASRRRFKG